MREILDRTVPETSEYLDGKARGKSLRQFLSKKRLAKNLLRDPRFKEHHEQLFYDLEMLWNLRRLYEGAGLRAPRRGR
ncbi:hypothetical protein [Microbacterium sp. Leaf436]|uniref:hypothetical protein n=1 Tax=Microbacterium sp. Leaf436 TaxID=1736377 RepID=UPI0006FDFE02|nr:hypothetical protein [Microbacterium sp. Leaf436]KQT72002.1 hypothetical protein ASG45_13570 [Microbacterium sp. Leaf436]